ncbi:hypothetical protein CTI12_AA491100 [Artemisia annua]|uniref:Uncharacterized protein n=1 Tax=Artemisia annua TaxID=35608 RepID=A0A2U1LHH5_ARTAN|nr:hypothetical protein CTI12_AA491100 [Artemisia annua]
MALRICFPGFVSLGLNFFSPVSGTHFDFYMCRFKVYTKGSARSAIFTSQFEWNQHIVNEVEARPLDVTRKKDYVLEREESVKEKIFAVSASDNDFALVYEDKSVLVLLISRVYWKRESKLYFIISLQWLNLYLDLSVVNKMISWSTSATVLLPQVQIFHLYYLDFIGPQLSGVSVSYNDIPFVDADASFGEHDLKSLLGTVLDLLLHWPLILRFLKESQRELLNQEHCRVWTLIEEIILSQEKQIQKLKTLVQSLEEQLLVCRGKDEFVNDKTAGSLTELINELNHQQIME